MWVKVLIVAAIFAAFCEGCGDVFNEKSIEDSSPRLASNGRVKRAATINKRKACQSGERQPKTRVDTTDRLEALREQMRQLGVDAMLIPSGDSHQSEYVAEADKRRRWIGGFTGSSGFAVVTLDKAAMWTDGRYFLQAEDELDCNWLFMKGEEHDDLAWTEWLGLELSANSKVGADPTLTGASTWIKWEEDMQPYKLQLFPLERNPIDDIWLERPERSTALLEVHDIKYAGLTWQTKLSKVREKLAEKKMDALVVSALDENAWLFNLRGKDIPYTPMFRSYAVIDANQAILYLPPEKQTRTVKEHLNAEDCSSGNKQCVQIHDYDSIFDELESLSDQWNSVLLGQKWAYSGGASYALYRLIPDNKRNFDLSPVMLMKAKKNQVEIRGMESANIRDAVALIDFADILEQGMERGEDWDELKADKRLTALRREQDLNRGLSFPTISAYGANGAVIHYKPNKITNTKIGKDAMYLLDSGGQYLDGTTDVTRTFHFGTPSDFDREVYTRVLMGSIDLARATFLKGTPDTRLDILARWNLWKVGLNYRHGTGHGIGAYGFIHESPVQVRVYAKEEHPMEEGYFFSDEPGYYEPGVSGVRLETVLRVVKQPDLPYKYKGYGEFYGFKPVCLVPFEPKLIDYDLLSDEQVDWLNRYNKLIRDKVGKELLKQGKNSAHKWMMIRTEPIHMSTSRQGRSSGSTTPTSILAITMCAIVSVLYVNKK